MPGDITDALSAPDMNAARATAEELTAVSARTSFTLGARRLIEELNRKGLLGPEHEASKQLLLLLASRMEQPGGDTAAMFKEANAIIARLEALLPPRGVEDPDLPGLDDPDFDE